MFFIVSVEFLVSLWSQFVDEYLGFHIFSHWLRFVDDIYIGFHIIRKLRIILKTAVYPDVERSRVEGKGRTKGT